MKRAAVGLIAILLALGTCMLLAGAANEPRISLRFYCEGKLVSEYFDEYIQSDEFWISSQIREMGINDSTSAKRYKMQRLRSEGADCKTCVVRYFPRIKGVVKNLSSALEIPCTDSKMEFIASEGSLFRIYPPKEGRMLDEDSLYKQIFDAIAGSTENINVRLKAVKPRVSVRDNVRLTCCRASFATDVGGSDSRKHNVELALSKLNGAVIDSGESLSFNRRVGKRTQENGYKTAKIIMDGEYVDGVGGGVCQASTTLYNCALLAGLDVQSVRAHSLRPSYVEASFDAMVSDGISDLVIKNNGKAPVFIRAFCSEGRAVVRIYGERQEYEIKRESVIVSEGKIPPDKIISGDSQKESGRKSYGAPKLESEGYLTYYKNGAFVKRRKIREDVYKEKQGVIVA